jgi:hypothetical protein
MANANQATFLGRTPKNSVPVAPHVDFISQNDAIPLEVTGPFLVDCGCAVIFPHRLGFER